MLHGEKRRRVEWRGADRFALRGDEARPPVLPRLPGAGRIAAVCVPVASVLALAALALWPDPATPTPSDQAPRVETVAEPPPASPPAPPPAR